MIGSISVANCEGDGLLSAVPAVTSDFRFLVRILRANLTFHPHGVGGWTTIIWKGQFTELLVN